ncbi:MAG: polysaccharide deacetylase family protein [Hydrogenimonas sp.]|nr:polysaccharide deacetylase family protein [Hydrogenimonas sp.]
MKSKEFLKTLLLQVGALRYANRSSKVIYYHDLHSKKRYTDMSTPIDLFKKHIDIAKKMGYRFVSDISSEESELEVTFDDGFRGLYENFDLFIENKIKIRLFMVSDFIGKEGYLKTSELEEMLKSGLLEIGSHGKSHNNFDQLSEDELKAELKESKTVLEEITQKPIDTLCFPRGRFNDMAIKIAQDIGYKKLYSCLPGPYYENFKANLINRSLVQHATTKQFKAILLGGDRIYHKRYLAMHYNMDGRR